MFKKIIIQLKLINSKKYSSKERFKILKFDKKLNRWKNDKKREKKTIDFKISFKIKY